MEGEARDDFDFDFDFDIDFEFESDFDPGLQSLLSSQFSPVPIPGRKTASDTPSACSGDDMIRCYYYSATGDHW